MDAASAAPADDQEWSVWALPKLFGADPPRADPPRALEMLAAKRQGELWESTLTLLERGKAEDAVGNWQAAAILYSEGLTGLEALSQVSKREDVLANYQAIVEQYTKRLSELHSSVMQGQATPQIAMGLPVAQAVATPASTSSAAASTAAAAPAAAPAESPSAAPLAQGRLCLELAMHADESGIHDEQTVGLYTAAAEHYFEALKLETDEEARTRHRSTVTMMLERAETLKRGETSSSPPAAPAAPVAVPAATPAAPTAPAAPAAPPRGGQMLADDEKEVLARSSKIAGKLFYPYMDDGQRERFHHASAWEDPDGLLPLSDKQREHFGRWARPSQFVRGEPTMIYLVSSLSITQTIITDCSFVSSLVIAAAYERRHGKQLITKIIYPQDRAGKPIYNPAGKYLVKLHINGIARKVLVDDRLPLSRDGRLMTSHTTHAQELWVSIIEKAYMKLNGGYDFPGSNSGIDMFALTGWIPEQFHTKDEASDFDTKRLWERMLSASKYGDCLLTVATGELAEYGGQEEEKVGLVRTHAYAVLQVREVLGQKLLQLKNPWAKLQWKGAYSASDKRWADAKLRQALNYDPSGAMQHDNGVFWIDYESLLRFFQGVYLNWNPQLFAHSTSHHGQWPKRMPIAGEVRDDSSNLGRNPQYGLSINVAEGKPAAVWLLLSRHTARKEQGRDDYLTVHVFKERGGHRVYYLEHCWRQGVYSNRPHCLVQFDLPPGKHKLTLALAQYKPVAHQVDYTLHAYAMASFSLRKLPYSMRETKRLNGAWKGPSAGGCGNYDSVVDNPRVLLTLEQPTDVQIELSGPERFPLGMELTPLTEGSGGGGGSGGGSSRPVATSGSYRNGFCLLEARAVPSGRYVLTAATFEPKQEGEFSVLIGSSQSVGAAMLHAEGHGLQRYVERGEWSVAAGTAAGSPNHGAFHRNLQLRMTLARKTDVVMRLRSPSLPGGRLEASRPHLGLAVYARAEPLGADEARARTRPRLSANGGVYSYPPGGALIPRTTLDAGSYVIVPSTFDPYNGPFELTIYASQGTVSLAR